VYHRERPGESTKRLWPSDPMVATNRYSWRKPLQLRWLWTEDRGMSFFLAILVAVIFIVMPLSGLGLVERFLVNIAFSLMLISGAVAARRDPVLTWMVTSLTIAGLAIHWMGVWISSFRHPMLDALLTILLFGSLVVVLMLQVFRAGQITI